MTDWKKQDGEYEDFGNFLITILEQYFDETETDALMIKTKQIELRAKVL